MAGQYVKQQLVVTTASFTPFVVSVHCNSIVFRNVTPRNIVLFRTDPADVTTQDSLNPNDQEVIPSMMRNVSSGSNQNYLFPAGGTFGWFQASTGTATILATLFGD